MFKRLFIGTQVGLELALPTGAPIGEYDVRVVVKAEESGPMLTKTGCTCKQTWTANLGSCDSYCCNPDKDAVGAWCLLEDKHTVAGDQRVECGRTGDEANQNWGYCDMSTSGNTLSKDRKPVGLQIVAPLHTRRIAFLLENVHKE